MSKRVECVLPDEIFGLLEEARGDVPRQRWLLKVICAAVSSEAAVSSVGHAGHGFDGGPLRASRGARPSVRDTWAR